MSEVKEKVNIDSFIETDDLVILDFYADWCGPCRAMNPVLEDLQKSNTGITIAKINVDNNQELAENFKVTAIPRFVFIKNKVVVETLAGAQPKGKLQEIINKHK